MRAFERDAERNGYARIAGVDEAGRGPLAGPVVSAAVILPAGHADPEINDSKKLSERKREALSKRIMAQAVAIGIGMADVAEIDRINILRAALQSMARAVIGLDPQPDFVLIDGNQPVPTSIPQKTVVGGDALSISIAAASIIAKVTRDRIMAHYDRIYPPYGFAVHKGYPTRAHREAIRRYGPCPIHRRAFRGVREHISPLFDDPAALQ